MVSKPHLLDRFPIGASLNVDSPLKCALGDVNSASVSYVNWTTNYFKSRTLKGHGRQCTFT